MAKIISFGVAVTVATNTVGALESVSIPETEITDIDVTTHDSSGGYREYLGGLKDGGVVTLGGKMNLNDTGQAYLNTASNQGGSAVAVVVTFSDTSTASFNAVVKGYGVENPLDESPMFTSSLRISGAVTYSAA